jgi:hypothetical protein
MGSCAATSSSCHSLNTSEHERNELSSFQLAPPWIDPDDGFVLFGAKEDHVVIRRYDNLASFLCMVQDHCVA